MCTVVTKKTANSTGTGNNYKISLIKIERKVAVKTKKRRAKETRGAGKTKKKEAGKTITKVAGKTKRRKHVRQ